MSHESTPVSAAHFDYIRAHCEAEDALLRELKDAARAAGIPAIWIAPEQARLLQILLRAARAREVVEVGTLAGYSALVMARALGPGGRVRTIEVSAHHAAFAREWIARAAPQATVEVLLGPGAAVLPTFADHSADALFVDADKAGYPLYLEQALRIVRPGGLLLVDNAFAFGQLLDAHPTDPDVPHVRAFNELMARCDRLEKVIVPVGDGLWVAIVR
ncbi:MAG: O-methyltransferase [Planctomycetes bacterium]|nr:O-methyltransferase [Planctomycetota bacterium]